MYAIVCQDLVAMIGMVEYSQFRNMIVEKYGGREV